MICNGMEYSEWLEDLIANRDKNGEPITRREYYKKYFNDVDPKRIYEQEKSVKELLRERGAITDT